MSETRIPGTCSCGRKVVKILNSKVPTMWVNGDRYIYPEREDGWCIFRCKDCMAVISDVFTAHHEQYQTSERQVAFDA